MSIPSTAFDAPETARLRDELEAFLRPFAGRTGDPPPAGRWLEDDLVLFARDDAGGTQVEIAERIGLSPSGFRARVQRLEDRPDELRPEDWWPVRFALRTWARTLDGTFPALDALRFNVLLVADPLFSTLGQVRKAAGVSEPTVRTWLEKLEEARPGFYRLARSSVPSYHDRGPMTVNHLLTQRARREMEPARQLLAVLALRGESLEDLGKRIGACDEAVEEVLAAAREGQPSPRAGVSAAIARETGVDLWADTGPAR